MCLLNIFISSRSGGPSRLGPIFPARQAAAGEKYLYMNDLFIIIKIIFLQLLWATHVT